MKNLIILISALVLALGCSSSKKFGNTSFSKEQVQLIMNSDSLKPMRVYKITNVKDSLLLRTKSHYIKPDPKNKVLRTFIRRLYATVKDSMSLGLGIAAPQVGILKNIIWVQRFDKENFPFEVYLNPIITNYSEEKQTVEEGCLSIPGRTETLNCRAKTILLEYDTLESGPRKETVEGFTAVIFQHEVDHLNGILYLDHLAQEIKDDKK